jgi:hypothetical protein
MMKINVWLLNIPNFLRIINKGYFPHKALECPRRSSQNRRFKIPASSNNAILKKYQAPPSKLQNYPPSLQYKKNDESLYGVNDLSVFSTDQEVRT